ncbi:MAG: acyltransferase family protein [Clostridia bacterium]|nr:acyltransferase family protein [Clostridia bacterium]MBR3095142.1 acyltransferase family protein [Clostridia bacterium]
MAQRRILWLDQLKAVGFFLVILGHMDIPGALNGWIYSFHMPLFFLVSGFTLNLKKTAEAPLRAQVPKLLKRMVLPYVWIELICLCFSFLNTVLLQGKELHLARNLLGIVIANGLICPYPSRPLYFALVLFLAQLLLWAALRLSGGRKPVAWAVTAALCVFSFLTLGKPMVWRVNVVPVAMLLMLVGTLLRRLYDRLRGPIETGNPLWLYLCGAALFAAGFVLQRFNGRLSMAGNRYGDYVPLGLLAAVLTTVALALFLIRLPVPRVMQIIGQNTFFYMGFHRPLITLLENLLPAYRDSWWFLTAGSLLIFFGLVPVVLLVNKACAFLCCKETEGETPAARVGRTVATGLALVIPYYYAVLAAVGRLALPAAAKWVLLGLFVPLCIAGARLLSRFVPVVYLTRRSLPRDGA